MNFPKLNFHTHTIFSDGNNNIRQIVTVALKLRINYLAITDHFSDSWKADVIPTLNTSRKIEAYLTIIEECQNFLKTTSKDLNLYKGVEIDLGSSVNFIRKLINPAKFDLILFEYLEGPEGISLITNMIKHWKKKISIGNNLPQFGLAHFDPSHFLYGGLDRLIQFLKEYNIYYEFNSSYSDYYSRRNEFFFEKLKEHYIPVAIGSDAHTLRGLGDIEDPIDMIKFYNLENNFELILKSLRRR